MRSLGCYIVRVANKYKKFADTKNSDVKILKDTTIADTFDAIREGEIVALPMDCESQCSIGDLLLFHHNIIYEQIMLGKRVVSDYCVDEVNGLYQVPIGLGYGYYSKGIFNALEGYVFVEPVPYPDSGSIINPNQPKEVKQVGVVRYGCKELEELGIVVGDTIIFSPYSEYPYQINRVKLYRMKVKDIQAKWDGNGILPNINLV